MVQKELAPKLKKAGEEIGRISDNVGFWVTDAGQKIAPASAVFAFIAGEHRIAVGAVISTAIFETTHRAFEQNIAKYSSGRADEVETGLEAARERTEIVLQKEETPLTPEQRLAARRLGSRLYEVWKGYQDQLADVVSSNDSIKGKITFIMDHGEHPSRRQEKLRKKAGEIEQYIAKLDQEDPGEALKFLEIQIYGKLAQAGRTPAAQYHDAALNQTRIDIETLAAFDPVKANGLRMELNKLQAEFTSHQF